MNLIYSIIFKPSDHEKRLEEAIVQTLISQFIKDLTIEERNVILQPNEDNVRNFLRSLMYTYYSFLIVINTY